MVVLRFSKQKRNTFFTPDQKCANKIKRSIEAVVLHLTVLPHFGSYKSCSSMFRKIRKKTIVPESIFK